MRAWIAVIGALCRRENMIGRPLLIYWSVRDVK